jgi:hypothetical protein
MIQSRPTRIRHRAPAARALPGLLAVTVVILSGLSATSAYSSTARVATSLNGTATAHLHLVKAEGSQLIEEGPVSGALSGSARGNFYTGAEFKGTVTLRTHTGSITGQGHATPHGSGRYQSFSGSFTLTGGTGRYSHARGHLALYGLFDRRTDSVTVQTVGSFSY